MIKILYRIVAVLYRVISQRIMRFRDNTRDIIFLFIIIYETTSFSSRRLAHALTDYEDGEIAKPYNNKFLLFINILAACDSII